MLHGTEDQIALMSGAEKAKDYLGPSLQRFEAFDGCRHDIYHEKDEQRLRAQRLVTEFLLDIVPSSLKGAAEFATLPNLDAYHRPDLSGMTAPSASPKPATDNNAD